MNFNVIKGEGFLKKRLMWMFVAFLMMMLSACGTSSEQVEGNKAGEEVTQEQDEKKVEEKEDEGVKKEATSSVTAETILEKSMEATNALESYSMDVNMNQFISIKGEVPEEISTTMKMDVTMNPFAMYQVMKINDVEMDGSMEMESYYTEDAYYMHDPFTNGWFKFEYDIPHEAFHQSPAEQMESLKAFASELTLKEDGDAYIITLDGAGDAYNELLQDASFIEEMDGMFDDIFSMITVNKISFEIHVNKTTFLQTKVNMTMDLEMNIEGEVMHTVQEMEMTVYNYNGINEIVVPQEVLDNIQDFNFGDFDYDFEFEDEEE